jgi:protease-4
MRRFLVLLLAVALVPVFGVRADEEKKEEKKPAAKAAKDYKKADKPTIAVFKLGTAITESPSDDPFLFDADRIKSFKDLIARLKQASEDPAVKAVVFLGDSTGLGLAQTEEVRQVTTKLRGAGKEVYVHADSLGMGQFALFSGASRLSVVPTADLWVIGLHGEEPYLRGLLDKLGVKPQFLTCGEYKSAAEIFMREAPSPQSEKMTNWLLDSIYDTLVQLIAKGRGVDVAKARSWIDNGPYTASKAKAAGLIDAVEHRQEFEAYLKEKHGKDVVITRKYGEKKPQQLDFSSPLAVF